MKKEEERGPEYGQERKSCIYRGFSNGMTMNSNIPTQVKADKLPLLESSSILPQLRKAAAPLTSD